MPQPSPVLNLHEILRAISGITYIPASPNASFTSPPDGVPGASQNSANKSIPGLDRKPEYSGLRYRFNKGDDLLLVREVTEDKAHIAPNGGKREGIEVDESKGNRTKRLYVVMTWKYVQVRYKRLQERLKNSTEWNLGLAV